MVFKWEGERCVSRSARKGDMVGAFGRASRSANGECTQSARKDHGSVKEFFHKHVLPLSGYKGQLRVCCLKSLKCWRWNSEFLEHLVIISGRTSTTQFYLFCGRAVALHNGGRTLCKL